MIIFLLLFSLFSLPMQAMNKKYPVLKYDYTQYDLPGSETIQERLDKTSLDKEIKLDIAKRFGDQKYSASAVCLVIDRCFETNKIPENQTMKVAIVRAILQEYPGAIEQLYKENYLFDENKNN